MLHLSSAEGKRRLEEAVGEGCAQKDIVAAWRQQRGDTCCGLASLATLLTAFRGSSTIDEDDVYPMATARTDGGGAGAAALVSDEKIRRAGMTLDQFAVLASTLPTTKKAIPIFPAVGEAVGVGVGGALGGAVGTTMAGPEALREVASQTLVKPSSVEALVLNYHMSTLGQTPFGGHLSPLAAYHKTSDSLLVMDVWHKTEPVWATVDLVWNAMTGMDSESGKPRGLLHVTYSNT